MSSLKCPDEILHFPNHMSIEINYANTVVYKKRNSYDPKLMSQGFIWHQIVIQHHGKLMGIEGKYGILDAIFRAVEGEEFYPIAYRSGNKEDRFLVRQCQAAMDKLFAQNLSLHLPKGIVVNLEVQLNVGEFKYGQISPIDQVAKALSSLYARMEHRNGEDGILNLSSFARNPELYDVVVNLSNRGNLERLCDLIYRDDAQFRSVNGIILSNNGINTLAPLKVFSGVQFAILDLSDNMLSSPNRVCRDLEQLTADELKLQGNPLTKAVIYPECLRPVLKNFKQIDGIPSENLSNEYTPLNRLETESEGYRIDWSNKADINKFENSTDWHAFMIPDINHEFTKEEVLDYFFLTISNTLSDIYPCYYQFSSGEHQFLVRGCFSQIKHLVEKCNLEIKIPSFEAPPPPTESTTDFSPQLHMDKSLCYYLKMNISPFKKGQVEPLDSIEKALNRRFSAMDRMLDLNNFHNVEGLENIVINLSSFKILNRVLMQASKKFLSTCIELRLAHNKILTANVCKALTMMSNLQAIDLGNNWIHNLRDIKDLGQLGIQSLRLDGNPLCSKYISATEYIKAVKEYFPNLKKLDNVEIGANKNLSSQKNFLCDTAGYDFVSEFVTRYFQTFESNRVYLKNLYHSKAIFTLTCDYNMTNVPVQSSKRILKYLNVSRNIFKIAELSRSYASVHYGPKDILKVLIDLPDISYDMLSLSTDCIVYNEFMVVITVNGVYLDQAPSLMETDIVLAFTRTFVLAPVQHKTGPLKLFTNYQIINDQFNVYTPSATQAKVAFKYFKGDCKHKKEELTMSDKEAILVLFQEATSLKSIWCARCLDEGNWDFEKSLEIFIQLSEKKEIPDTAFNK